MSVLEKLKKQKDFVQGLIDDALRSGKFWLAIGLLGVLTTLVTVYNSEEAKQNQEQEEVIEDEDENRDEDEVESEDIESDEPQDIVVSPGDDTTEDEEDNTERRNYEQCKANVLPSYINISTSWGSPHNTTALGAFQSLSPPAVIVTSAGNNANKIPPRYFVDANKRKASEELDAIIVGSVDAFGNRSHFSQQSREIAIVAPSDHMLSSANNEGFHRNHSGTSGSTALVTGALAGFTKLSGFQPTGAEVKTLLEKTAIPLRTSNTDRKLNGAGMLNAYKLGAVAKRLKQRCGQDATCFKHMLTLDSTYEFPEDTDLSENVAKAFPECDTSPGCGSMCDGLPPGTVCAQVCVPEFKQCLKRNNSCEDKKAAFKSLRKAAFLNPNKKENWRLISCIYAASGLHDNARGARNIYNALSGAPPAETLDERVGRYTDKSCTSDRDCALIPSCDFDYANNRYFTDIFQPANKNYVSECQGSGALCNGKCRCQPGEQIDILSFETETSRTLSTRCVDSVCTMQTSDSAINPVDPPVDPEHLDDEIQPEVVSPTGTR